MNFPAIAGSLYVSCWCERIVAEWSRDLPYQDCLFSHRTMMKLSKTDATFGQETKLYERAVILAGCTAGDTVRLRKHLIQKRGPDVLKPPSNFVPNDNSVILLAVDEVPKSHIGPLIIVRVRPIHAQGLHLPSQCIARYSQQP